MASLIAIRKCPELIFDKLRFEAYKAVSTQIRGIFAEFTDQIEPLSLDEAYLDVTNCLSDGQTATQLAQTIKERIKDETYLTSSVGMSYNKFLAKLASDYRKPDGLFVIKPRQGLAFVETLKVGQFHGIGRETAERMNELSKSLGRKRRPTCQRYVLKSCFTRLKRSL